MVRTWTATDDCGNTAQAIQRITVGDTTPPVLSGVPADTNVECDDLGNVPGGANVSATDNCDDNVNIEMIETTENTGGCAGAFTLVRTWTATDDCGNTAQATQRITIGDSTPPVLSGVPADRNAECGDNLDVQQVVVTASDNCDDNVDVEMTENTEAGDCPDSFTLVRTWTATDDCGNTAQASQRITVGDNTPPVISGVANDITLECGESAPDAGNVTATDNCDNNVLVELEEVGGQGQDCRESFTITRTWTATDACGNVATETQIITVSGDNTPPVLAGIPADEQVDCGQVPGTNAANVSATDACDQDVQIDFAETIENGDCADAFTIVRTWTATDDCGNQSTGVQRITVGDNTPPVLSGVPADANLECGQSPDAPASVTATDNCDDNVTVSMDEQQIPGTCEGSFT